MGLWPAERIYKGNFGRRVRRVSERTKKKKQRRTQNSKHIEGPGGERKKAGIGEKAESISPREEKNSPSLGRTSPAAGIGAGEIQWWA